jgi:hypothetical protein
MILFCGAASAETVIPKTFVYGMIALSLLFIAFIATYVVFLIKNRGTDFKGKK